MRHTASAFAPTNIALCKYWGKRDTALNLPVTSSLSISLADKGATTTISVHEEAQDIILLNGKVMATNEKLGKRVCQFLDLFRDGKKFHIDMQINVPLAAGLASSACSFASLVLALNDLLGWNLSARDLSILARQGSGSAARSLWQGFVEWHAGTRADGTDSFAEPIAVKWPELRVGLLILSEKSKPIPSREAMQRTVETSALYKAWPQKVAHDLALLKRAIQEKNFSLLGATAESNAMTMHATMLSAWPPVCYYLPETLTAMQKIWQLRSEGVDVYFTQDAGPNLKLLFLQKDQEAVLTQFSAIEIVQPFTGVN